jgi:hypothetical protein
MPRALKLMQAIVGPTSDETLAKRLLEEALLTEVDPLLHAAFSLGIDINTALERAASSLGLAYFETVPSGSRSAGSLRIERLAEVHFVRATTLGEEVAYASPDFNGLMRLGVLHDTDPSLTRRLCVVPAAALRQYLASIAAPDLLVAARQGLARHWPTATASLELTLGVRIAFGGAVLLLVVTLLALPFLAAAWLMPVWATIMLLPALVRLAALFMPNRATAPEERVDAQDLPIYSVLVPLRDEAEMVDQLSRVLGGLDYPGHRLDIIFVVEQRSPRTVEAADQAQGARFRAAFLPGRVRCRFRCRGSSRAGPIAAGGQPVPPGAASPLHSGPPCHRQWRQGRAASAVCRRICGAFLCLPAGPRPLGRGHAAGRHLQSLPRPYVARAPNVILSFQALR